jgi:hypothetical protein
MCDESLLHLGFPAGNFEEFRGHVRIGWQHGEGKVVLGLARAKLELLP